MALDFVLAENPRAAVRGEVTQLLELEEENHARIFSLEWNDFPTFRRMEASDREILGFFSRLVEACERADRDGMTLLVRCDGML